LFGVGSALCGGAGGGGGGLHHARAPPPILFVVTSPRGSWVGPPLASSHPLRACAQHLHRLQRSMRMLFAVCEDPTPRVLFTRTAPLWLAGCSCTTTLYAHQPTLVHKHCCLRMFVSRFIRMPSPAHSHRAFRPHAPPEWAFFHPRIGHLARTAARVGALLEGGEQRVGW
jgi:hypothetical protein